MAINQVANHIILGTVAFSVSVSIGVFTNPEKALLNGVITVLASSAGSIVANKRLKEQEKRHIGSLLHQIEAFEAEKSILYESVSQGMEAKQQLEASINALQIERSQLLIRVSELHAQRNNFYHELAEFQGQKQQKIDEIENLKRQIKQIEQHQIELNQSLWAKTAQVQPAETRLNRLHGELDRLHSRIADKLHQQKQLERDLAILESQKQELGGEAYDLKTNILALKQRGEQINHSLLYLRMQHQEVQETLISLEGELEEMASQVSVKQEQQEQLNRDLANLEHLKQQLESDYHKLQREMEFLHKLRTINFQALPEVIESKLPKFFPEEWLVWLEFSQQLSQNEKIALKAILAGDEVALKQIADEQFTIPQSLINSINDRALATFQDILLVSKDDSVIPDVNQEYISILVEPTSIYFKDLLTITSHTSSHIHSVMEEQKL
jgi:chromosome segregation ATPase